MEVSGLSSHRPCCAGWDGAIQEVVAKAMARQSAWIVTEQGCVTQKRASAWVKLSVVCFPC